MIGAQTASYAYNGGGLRMSKTVNGTAEGYVWDEAEGMPLIIQDGSTKYITGPGGLPVEQVDGSGTVSYYLQDQLGSTRGLIDSSGTIVGTCEFGAYGSQQTHTGASTPFGYAGQYTDTESGFQYLRARYYDPTTEQFATVDPIVDLTQEPYSYGGGSPLFWSDPSGELCIGPAPVPWSGDTFASCSRQVSNAIDTIKEQLMPSRRPAYVGLCASTGSVVGGQICFDRTPAGRLYATPSLGLTTPGATVNVHAGYIHGAVKPTECQTDAYLSGWTLQGSATAILSVSGVWGNEGHFGNSDYGDELGFGWEPGLSLMQGYGFLLPVRVTRR